MDAHDIALEMLNFLNETGQYQNFMDWADNKGFDINELELDIDELND